MKIDKGYTLSQFVDDLKKMFTYNKNPQMVNLIKSDYFDLIVKYNEFLKQPLKKEMFVNEFEKPNESLILNGGFSDYELYNKQNSRYKEAEKKVIFKNILKSNNDYTIEGTMFSLMFVKNIVILDDGNHYEMKTLYDLFQATNGELQLQNVEI